jgi:hypothetical protein
LQHAEVGYLKLAYEDKEELHRQQLSNRVKTWCDPGNSAYGLNVALRQDAKISKAKILLLFQ